MENMHTDVTVEKVKQIHQVALQVSSNFSNCRKDARKKSGLNVWAIFFNILKGEVQLLTVNFCLFSSKRR